MKFELKNIDPLIFKIRMLYKTSSQITTDMRRLTTGIRSEKMRR